MSIPIEGLESAARALGLELTVAQLNGLQSYLSLLLKWNKVYNLTAVRDPADMLTHHVVDSLAVIGPLRHQLGLLARGEGARILDVGSGAGLPGVVLALCCPQWHVTCVDTVGKKVAFIQQVAAALKLPNLVGLHGRVEKVQVQHDVVCSRAFASLTDFTNWSANALAPDGLWMAMKGKLPSDEMSALAPDVEVFHVEPLLVPGLNADRCLVWMRKKSGDQIG